MQTKIEYRVRPVTRYVVTRYVETDDPAMPTERTRSSEVLGEYQNENAAAWVAQSLCAHDRDSAKARGRDDITLVDGEPSIY